MPLDYNTRKKLYAYRSRKRQYKTTLLNIKIFVRSCLSLVGVLFNKLKPEKEDYFYDEYSDRSDDVRSWYEKRLK